jgi:hypothetical protein
VPQYGAFAVCGQPTVALRPVMPQSTQEPPMFFHHILAAIGIVLLVLCLTAAL